ncbi:MAG TPA: AMP-binding protein [Acidimicrobiales bacterium]|nr:AMP-binding protein [Acidimicrobiales bacterium]
MTDRHPPSPMTASRVWRIRAEESERDQARVAGALRRAGLHRGDRLALVLPNSPGLLAAILGSLRIGVIPVLLHAGLLAHERRVLLDDAQPQLVVDDEAALAGLLSGPSSPLAPVPLARPMHYTSGTSGRPKGVWSGVLDPNDAQRLFEDEAAVWRFDASDALLICSPLYHSAAVRFSASTLLTGGEVILLERFDATTAAHAIEQEQVRTAFMVPAHLQRLFALPRLPDLSSFRLLAHAGAPCPEPLKRAALAAFPPGAVWEFYGSTEGQFTVCSPDEWLAHPGTVGRARPGRRLEVDADDQIWCHVPPYARFEYWRDHAKTAAAWRGDAFTVGDIGRLTEDGYLFLDGRRDDLIISGGVNVYPAEVEGVLSGLPGVEEVAVFGAPDERWGQRVCAAVVGAADPSAVLAHARERLAAYKCPKNVYVVEDLPRTVTGKVRRSAVAAALGLA